jgi:hypothetical protein
VCNSDSHFGDIWLSGYRIVGHADQSTGFERTETAMARITLNDLLGEFFQICRMHNEESQILLAVAEVIVQLDHRIDVALTEAAHANGRPVQKFDDNGPVEALGSHRLPTGRRAPSSRRAQGSAGCAGRPVAPPAWHPPCR